MSEDVLGVSAGELRLENFLLAAADALDHMTKKVGEFRADGAYGFRQKRFLGKTDGGRTVHFKEIDAAARDDKVGAGIIPQAKRGMDLARSRRKCFLFALRKSTGAQLLAPAAIFRLVIKEGAGGRRNDLDRQERIVVLAAERVDNADRRFLATYVFFNKDFFGDLPRELDPLLQ